MCWEPRFKISWVMRSVSSVLVVEMCIRDSFNQFVDKGLLDRLNHVLNSDFGHVTYTEAVEILEKNNDNFDYKVYWGCDLQTEHERYLTEQVFKKPVFVTEMCIRDRPKRAVPPSGSTALPVKYFLFYTNPNTLQGATPSQLLLPPSPSRWFRIWPKSRAGSYHVCRN